jgi:hypothetical protein
MATTNKPRDTLDRKGARYGVARDTLALRAIVRTVARTQSSESSPTESGRKWKGC